MKRNIESERQYEEYVCAQEAALRPQLTAAFLATLVEAVQTCGWSVDQIETISFVDWCFELAGQPKPSAETWREPEREVTS